MGLLYFLFNFTVPVTRKQYFFTGVTLLLVKYLGEVAFIYAAKDVWLMPLDFLNPIASERYPFEGDDLLRYGFWLGLWQIPFLWIGVGMSVRRSIDAVVNPWVVPLFFLPFVNYVLMLALSIAPTRRGVSDFYERASFLSATTSALMVTALLSITAFYFSVTVFKEYGVGIFVGLPIVMGMFAGFLANRKHDRGAGATIAFALLANIFVAGVFLVLAMEGLICLLMAAPITLACSIPGALIGRMLSRKYSPRFSTIMPVLLAVPTLNYADTLFEPTQFEVLSTVEISATPETVWKHVVSFSELPPPTEAIFKLGIAHPLRAKIMGTGVGAIRHCEFSTGPFVEPITAWEPPKRLAFDVTENPLPMKELNPFSDLHVPHLKGYMQSDKGEFRLIQLDNGKIRLEGRTWYRHGLYPEMYWKWFSDGIIHKIHGRVLNHIKNLSETEQQNS